MSCCHVVPAVTPVCPVVVADVVHTAVVPQTSSVVEVIILVIYCISAKHQQISFLNFLMNMQHVFFYVIASLFANTFSK